MTSEARVPPPADAIRLMKTAADEAEERGDSARADGLRHEICVMKFQIAERQRVERPAPSRLGPGTVQLFTRTGTLGDDNEVGGL